MLILCWLRGGEFQQQSAERCAADLWAERGTAQFGEPENPVPVGAAGIARYGKSALSRGATRAALAATAMGIDKWLNDEESDFAVAKKTYMAMGLSEEKAVNQVKADCVRYILGEGLSGATEGAVAAGLEVGRYKKTAEEVGKTVKESGEAAELMDKLNRLPEDTAAKRFLTKARDAFMEKAEKKLNRLKDAYEEENYGDLTIGKIERIGQLSNFIMY